MGVAEHEQGEVSVRSLLAPRMLALHVLVLAVLVVLGSLGTWQLDRLGEATQRATAIETRLVADPAPVGDVLAGLTLADEDALAAREFRPVTATGTWQPQDEVLQRGRSHRGRAGLGVLTPLLLEDGSTVLVRRGTVPFDNELRPPLDEALPPTGTVTVTGTLERTVPQPSGGFAQRDPDVGELALVFNADLSRLGEQLDEPLLPMLVRLEEPAPDDGLPLPEPPPAPDRGPHLSYAVQWFGFAAIAGTTYVVWLVRRARGLDGDHAVAPQRL